MLPSQEIQAKILGRRNIRQGDLQKPGVEAVLRAAGWFCGTRAADERWMWRFVSGPLLRLSTELCMGLEIQQIPAGICCFHSALVSL